MGVADDKGHRHGFTQRAAQTQHHATDDSGLGVGQHHIPHHFPGGSAQTVGRFLQHGGDDFKHITHDSGDKGNHHHRQNQSRSEHAYAQGRALEQQTQQRYLA